MTDCTAQLLNGTLLTVWVPSHPLHIKTLVHVSYKRVGNTKGLRRQTVRPQQTKLRDRSLSRSNQDIKTIVSLKQKQNDNSLSERQDRVAVS